MNRILQGFALAVLAVAPTACSDSNGTAPDDTGSTSTGGSTTSTGGAGGSSGSTTTTGGASSGGSTASGNSVPITPDPTGWVEGRTNVVGIQGAWYSYNDCTTSPGDCTMNQIPVEGSFDNVGGKMCTSGTTAAVADQMEFSLKWGAGIGLDLNNSGGTDAMKMPYDADAAGVVGFSFTISGTDATGLRFNITSVAAGDNSHFVSAAMGENTVMFSDAMQGSWVTTKTPLDTTQLLAIQFQIPSVLNQSVAFDFCVENLAAITQ
jgi:hypothetical protein